jgi:hypothetical protein
MPAQQTGAGQHPVPIFMPLNEARLPVRSNLTKQQKREAIAAIGGYKESTNMAGILDSMTAEQIAALQEELLNRQKKVGNQTFDINNPPKHNYVHQSFPKMIYHHATRKHRVVQNQDELDAHLEQGWDKTPYLPEGHEGLQEPELDPDTEAEIAAADIKAKRGRPRKVAIAESEPNDAEV